MVREQKAVDEYLAAANVPIFHPKKGESIGIKPQTAYSGRLTL